MNWESRWIRPENSAIARHRVMVAGPEKDIERVSEGKKKGKPADWSSAEGELIEGEEVMSAGRKESFRPNEEARAISLEWPK